MYMFNGLAVNPAYAGSREVLSTTMLYRHQWAGFEGAPKTLTFTAHAPLMNDKVGLGFSLINDNIGVTNTLTLAGNYAYRIPMGKGKMSLGLLTTISHYKAKWEQLVVNDVTDRAFDENSKSLFIPNFGFGAYYYVPEKYYVGFSVPHLLHNSLNTNFELEGTTKVARQYNHYFATAGYVWSIRADFKIKPSVLFKYQPNAPFQADINLSLLMFESLWIGASYRTGDAAVFIFEYYFAERLRAGYAYDYILTEIGNFTSGSHEVMLGYEFRKKDDAYLTPRQMSYF